MFFSFIRIILTLKIYSHFDNLLDFSFINCLFNLSNAILTDFSAGGASLEAPVQFGISGDKIVITGKFKMDESEKTITIPCSICQVRGNEDIKTKDVKLQHGVKFEFVNKEDENFVKNLIAQQIVYAKTRKIL